MSPSVASSTSLFPTCSSTPARELPSAQILRDTGAARGHAGKEEASFPLLPVPGCPLCRTPSGSREASDRDSRSRQRAVLWPQRPGRRQLCEKLRRRQTWGLAKNTAILPGGLPGGGGDGRQHLSSLRGGLLPASPPPPSTPPCSGTPPGLWARETASASVGDELTLRDAQAALIPILGS